MKSTKQTFIISVLSIVLCVAMLLGTTFAWFTDTVTSGANTIVAGNLDIDVQYTKDNGAHWADLEGSESVFSSNLWEPGYTEYVTLKIENKGTLALKYSMNVTPINEKGGVNVNGESFKLSDYLVFGTTDPATTLPTYDRASAREAVGETTGMNQSALTKSTDMAPNAVNYITLVVYMPESVGNVANYKTGTAAPEIQLGIKFVATQFASESDSFGNDYDGDAVNVAPYNVGPVYDYFPQVFASSPVAEEGATVISATGKLNKEDAEDTELAKVTVPAEAVKEGATELTVSVKPVEATNENALNQIQTQKAAGQEVANFDIKVDGIKEGNEAAITVEVFVGKGLSNVKAFHNGVEITGATYDASTGKVTFTTTSFSDYTVSYDSAMVAIGDKTYGTLALAIDAVNNNETIVLLKDVASAGGISVASGKNFTVDFNGFTYTTEKPGAGSANTKTQAFQLLKDSTITFKNGTIACTEANKDATWTSESTEKGVAMIIQNYANLTLDNMVIDGRNIAHNGATVRYVMSNNCGNVSIKDTKILTAAGDFAFDSCKYGDYAAPTVTVSGKSEINGNIEATGGTIVVESGTFTDDPSEFVADGYKATENDGLWTIVEKFEASINGTMYKNLTDAISAVKEGETVVLLADYTPELTATGYWGDKYYVLSLCGLNNVTIDFNGHRVNGIVSVGSYAYGYEQSSANSGYNMQWKTGAPSVGLVFTDSSANGLGGISSSDSYGAINVKIGSDLTINGGTYYQTYAGSASGSSGYAPVIVVDGANLIINNGTFENRATKGSYNSLIKLDNEYSSELNGYSGCEVTINGGSFKALGSYSYVFTGTSMSNCKKMDSVIINNGTFETGSYGYLISGIFGTAVINDCNYKTSASNAFSTSYYNTTDHTVTVNGGQFEITTYMSTWNIPLGSFAGSYPTDNAPVGKVELRGGTINSYICDGSMIDGRKSVDLVADGYHVVDNGNGTKSVVAD